jgi:hypothetical protein
VLRGGRDRRISRIVPIVLLLATACTGGVDAIALDGTPRHADAQGVVTAVSNDRLTLDGTKTYDIDPKIQCFSASTQSAIPLAGRKGTFVQLGLDGKTVKWLAGYSAVIEFPGRPSVAYHNGVLEEASGRDAIFEDGSVLPVGAGVDAPPPGSRVTAEIDVKKKAITRFTPAAAVARPAAP